MTWVRVARLGRRRRLIVCGEWLRAGCGGERRVGAAVNWTPYYVRVAVDLGLRRLQVSAAVELFDGGRR